MVDSFDIQQLVKLFHQSKDDDSDSNSSDTCETAEAPNVNQKQKETKPNPYSKAEPLTKEENVLSHLSDEVDILSETDISSDWKKTPKWEISYRQKVTASDVFLQMGAKTPATASCEDMIVTIDLPGEHMQNIDVKVEPNTLKVISSHFNLKIPLPHPVHPQKGDAKWDTNQEKLIVTLKMEREFDFINF